jgi:hypothetical protein
MDIERERRRRRRDRVWCELRWQFAGDLATSADGFAYKF